VHGERVTHRQDVPKFYYLRLAIKGIAHLGLKEDGTGTRIFHLFTDTTSQMEDFRRVESFTDGDGRLFKPIVNIPTYDYHANSKLDITIDPNLVSNSQRLLHFGRSAWLSMSTNLETREILAIASKKLTKSTSNQLLNLFRTGVKSEADQAVMMAIMSCRLGLQIGAAVKLTHDLVASHMMTTLHVPREGNTLVAHYPSEPILAEASAEVTARLGWDKPLESLIGAI